MSKKKTKIKLELTRRDFMIVGGVATGSVVASQLLTTGPLSPYAGFKQDQVEGLEEASTTVSKSSCGKTYFISRRTALSSP